MEFVPAIAMMALIWKVVDLIKSAKAGDTNGAVSIVLTWLVAIAVVMLYAQTAWADTVSFGQGFVLSKLNFWSQVAVGLNIGGGAGALFDLKKAIDRTDSARVVSLLPGKVVEVNDNRP